MDDKQLLGLLGLSRRSGKAALGEEEAAAAALAHKARLVLIAADASEKTALRASRAAETGNAPCLRLSCTKAELGGALGRGSCAVMALTDVGFAAAAARRLAALDPTAYGEVSQRLSAKAQKTVRRRREKQRRLKRAQSPKPWAPPPKEEQG